MLITFEMFYQKRVVKLLLNGFNRQGGLPRDSYYWSKQIYCMLTKLLRPYWRTLLFYKNQIFSRWSSMCVCVSVSEFLWLFLGYTIRGGARFVQHGWRFRVTYTFFYTSNQFISNRCSGPWKMKQLLRLKNHLLLKNCIDYAFFHCFLVKFTKIHGILSNFVRKNRKKFNKLLRLRPDSGCL